jgi:glycosyltransferase involved in cell wall biosynthesis
MTPRISVVMPAWQAERTIGAAVSSVLSQTADDLELVVVDDGSTDATAAIAAAHPGARVVRQENAGVAAARNRGVEEARGDLVTFCDADDILLPRHLEALLAVWERHGGIATANCYWLFEGGIHPSRRRYKGGFPPPGRQRLAILEQNFVSTMSLFPRALAGEIGGFDPERRRAEDWDFWIRAIYAGHRVALQPEPLALYRWGATSLASDWRDMDQHVHALLRRAAARDDLAPEERAYLERRLAGPGPLEIARVADEALRAGRYADAARGYREAAALVSTEPRLRWKARLLGVAPGLAGPLVRARQLRIERRMGFEEGNVR